MSYRTQLMLRRALMVCLWLVIIGLLLWACWMVWIQRYVVYTRSDGAVLNFEMSETLPAGQVARPPETDMEIEIYYNEGEGKVDLSTELSQLKG